MSFVIVPFDINVPLAPPVVTEPVNSLSVSVELPVERVIKALQAVCAALDVTDKIVSIFTFQTPMGTTILMLPRLYQVFCVGVFWVAFVVSVVATVHLVGFNGKPNGAL